MLTKKPTRDVALNRIAAQCARSEYCPSEVHDKFLKMGFSPTEADEMLQKLIDDRFVDEARYVRAFVRDKSLYDRWGQVKIRYALRNKRIDDDLIERQLEEAFDETSYLDRLRALLQQKLRTMSQPLTPTDRAKLYRFAAQRGYESRYVSQAFHRLGDCDDEEAYPTDEL